MSAAQWAGFSVAAAAAIVVWFLLGKEGAKNEWSDGWRNLSYATIAAASLIAVGTTSGYVPAPVIIGLDSLLVGPLVILLGHTRTTAKSNEELVDEVLKQRRIPEEQLSLDKDDNQERNN